jgi:hypothetical protein
MNFLNFSFTVLPSNLNNFRFYFFILIRFRLALADTVKTACSK